MRLFRFHLCRPRHQKSLGTQNQKHERSTTHCFQHLFCPFSLFHRRISERLLHEVNRALQRHRLGSSQWPLHNNRQEPNSSQEGCDGDSNLQIHLGNPPFSPKFWAVRSRESPLNASSCRFVDYHTDGPLFRCSLLRSTNGHSDISVKWESELLGSRKTSARMERSFDRRETQWISL